MSADAPREVIEISALGGRVLRTRGAALRGTQHRRRNSTLGAVFTRWLLLALFMEPRMTKACRRPPTGQVFRLQPQPS